MGNVHVFDITNICFHGMFDTSGKLIVGQSDDIYGVTPSNWEDSTWKLLSLVGDEEVISLSHAKVYVFSDSVLRLGKMHQNPQSNTVWEDKLTWFKSVHHNIKMVIPRTWITKKVVFYS